MISYAIDADLLTPFIAGDIEPDFYQGKCYLSLVALHSRNLKVYGVMLPFCRRHTQVNLRFYVHRRISNDWRRGVIFIRQVVSEPLIAWAARCFFQESVVSRPVEMNNLSTGEGAEQLEYGWSDHERRYSIRAIWNRWSSWSVAPTDRHYFIDRFWGYRAQEDGGFREYHLSHPSWEGVNAKTVEVSPDLADFYGPPFCELLRSKPDYAFVVNGSLVSLDRGKLF